MNLPIPIFRNEINALGDFKGGVKVARDFAAWSAVMFSMRRSLVVTVRVFNNR